MGKIFYLMGKSATGKDTIYQQLMKLEDCHLGQVVLYTTRPLRANEVDGVTYHFITEDQVHEMERQGKIIEMRCYQTVHGPWYYLTADDGQIDLTTGSYLMIGTLESYQKMLQYYGAEVMVPLYIWIPDLVHITRALEREKQQAVPKIAEMCRRYLADEQDFCEENLADCGIGPDNRYENLVLEDCIKQIRQTILHKTQED